MTTWLNETQALEYLGIPVNDDTRRKLRRLAHRKIVRWTSVMRIVQYDQDSLDEYRESKAMGKPKKTDVEVEA